MKRSAKLLIFAGGLVVAVAAIYIFASIAGVDVVVVEKDRVEPATPENLLPDDRLEDKRPGFLPHLVDSRLLGPVDNRWQWNLSAAVIALDVPDLHPEKDAALDALFGNYVAAAKHAEDRGYHILPSINMVAAKAKQFDDGLYAAVDAWMVQNAEEGVRDLELLLRQMMAGIHPTHPAHGWLWAALEVGGLLSPDEFQRRPRGAEDYVRGFLTDPDSTPVGFYDWNEDLRRIFRFLRFLQQTFDERAGIPDAIAGALAGDDLWMEEYKRMLRLYAGLSNPFDSLSLADLVRPDRADMDLPEIAERTGLRPSVAFLPSSISPETLLFERLYPFGPPAGADLMRDFITAVREGRLDLGPRPDSGWYDYQLYALETFLLPGRGAEHEKLLLSSKYKQRLLEAFKSVVTTTRETHIRQQRVADGLFAPPDDKYAPPLRVEPNPTYYLRLGRGYGFVQTLLKAEMSALGVMRGYREDGRREFSLADELEQMRLLCYGLHLVSCEDIGLEPQLLPDELEHSDYARAFALAWLGGWREDADMMADVRVAVPIMAAPGRPTRFWGMIGVRPAKLKASFARPPRWRPEGAGEDAWEDIPRGNLGDGDWVILVGEFAEFDWPTRILTRDGLRKVCEEFKTREKIVAALSR